MFNKNIFTTFKKGIMLICALCVILTVTACTALDTFTSGRTSPTVEDSTSANNQATNNDTTSRQTEQPSSAETQVADSPTNEQPESSPASEQATNTTAAPTEPEPTPTPEVSQQVEPPSANDTPTASANPHPFANALSEFFVNIAPVPDWALPSPEHSITMPFSTHAMLVDVDGNGTQGMLASKWTTDVQRYLPQSSAESLLVHRLFLLANDQARPIALDNIAVTPTRRLITMSGVDGQGISMSAHTLLGFNNNQLTPIKSIARTAYGHWEYHGVETWVSSGEDDSYFVNYHTSEFWNRDWEQDLPLTNAGFHQLMTRYGLNGAIPSVWELPDETNAILSMTAD